MIRLNKLQQLRDLDTASPQFNEQLSSCLRGNDFRGATQNFQGDDLTWLVEHLDSILVGISDPTSVTFLGLLHKLRQICGTKGVLPNSCTLPAGSRLDLGPPSVSGDACEGTLDGSKVRIRHVRIVPGGDLQKVKEVFHQAAVVWKHLEHPNIIPLLGATIDPPQLVLDWMCGGDLTEYITNNPDANRQDLLSDVAGGLNYLHSCGVIHGDLKGPNVLVDTAGHARITGFGLVMVTQNLGPVPSVSDEHGDNARWIAPEILNNRGTCSKEGDVFSFAMVVIEAFTGAIPFSNEPPHAAMLAIIRGECPPRPTHPALTDRLWALTQQCWDQEARQRPRALKILCGFGMPAWKRLIDRFPTKDERVPLIETIFSDRDEVEVVKCLRGDDAQSFVDVMDETLDILAPQLRERCLNALCEICGRQALLPRSVQIPLCYDQSSEPVCRGGFADVWKGDYEGREVAVKVLVTCSRDDPVKIIRMFCKEVMTWKSLRHRNVLPLLGGMMCNNRLAMASEWMTNGDVNKFIKAHRNVNQFELLKDVARGLVYMHNKGMVHGDLKGANILIDQGGHARLADFGFTTIVFDPTYSTTSSASTTGGTTRWMSPERLDPIKFGFKNIQPTKESDCYALGMVILEVLSGQVPFQGCTDPVVIQRVLKGEHPERPQGPWFTDDLWGMLERCWLPKPNDRPTVEDILEILERISTVWQPLPPSMDTSSNVEADIDCDQSSLTVSGPGMSVVSSPINSWFAHRDPTISAKHRLHIKEGKTEVRRIIHQESEKPEAPALVTPQPTSTLISLMKAAHRDRTSQDINQVLATAFGSKDYLDCIKGLRAQDIHPLSYTNSLDEIIDGLLTGSDLRKQCIRALSGTCSLYGILPTSHEFTGKLSKSGQQPFTSGVNFDVWRLADEKHQDQFFAVKVLRFYGGDPVEKLSQKYFKEAIVSKRVNHPNILPIEGVAPELFEFCMVSQWMECGDILDYVRRYPEVDRLELLIGIACGLNYLHNNEIVHGDLKSPNILIDTKGSPRLCDFSNCSFTRNTEPVNALTPTYDCTPRWSAPERLNESAQEREPTTMSDVYSLSMVIVELITGKIPFPEFTSPNVIVMVTKGKRPLKPRSFDAPGMTPAVWRIAQKCWCEEAKERPEVNTVLRSLENLADEPTQAPFLQWWRSVFDY